MPVFHRGAGLAVAALLAAAPADAVTIEEVRSGLRSWLDSTSDLATKGEPDVREVGGEVVAELPTLVLTRNEGEIEIPDVILHLRSTADDRVAFKLRLPDRVSMRDTASREPITTLVLGSQRIEGIYQPSHGYAPQLFVELGDIAVAPPGGAPIRIGSLAAKYAIVEATPKDWTIGGEITVSDLYLGRPEEAGRESVPLMPVQLDADFRLEHAPGLAAWRTWLSTAFAASADQKLLSPRLLSAMAQAGTVLILPKLVLEAGIASLRGTAAVGLPPEQSPGQPLAVDLSMTGLDDLVQRFSAEPSREPGYLLSALFLLRGIGRPQATNDGEIAYRFELNRGPDGEILLNGTDIGQLLGRSSRPPGQ